MFVSLCHSMENGFRFGTSWSSTQVKGLLSCEHTSQTHCSVCCLWKKDILMKHLIKRTSSEAICFVNNYLLILALCMLVWLSPSLWKRWSSPHLHRGKRSDFPRSSVKGTAKHILESSAGGDTFRCSFPEELSSPNPNKHRLWVNTRPPLWGDKLRGEKISSNEVSKWQIMPL